MTPTDFLLARIAEDEERARAAMQRGLLPGDGPARWRDEDRDENPGHSVVWNGVGQAVVSHAYHHQGAHIARWDPVRVLAECEAKRRIVERASRPVYTFGPAEPPSLFAELTFSGGRVYADPYREVDVTEAYLQEVAAHSEPADPATLRDLAAVYADHPDYRSEWKP